MQCIYTEKKTMAHCGKINYYYQKYDFNMKLIELKKIDKVDNFDFLNKSQITYIDGILYCYDGKSIKNYSCEQLD